MYSLDDHPTMVLGAFVSGSLHKTPETPVDAAPSTGRWAQRDPELHRTLVGLWVSLAGRLQAVPDRPAVD